MMKARKCDCGSEPAVYGFCVQCKECGQGTKFYAKQENAITSWNEHRDLVVKEIKKELTQ